MRFIGHLDLQRFFQKAMRKAEIPIRFTEGMSPHMVMSFACPLGVGLASDAEYIDIEITSPVTEEDALALLNGAMPEGLKILAWRKIPEDRSENAMSIVAAADYRMRFREGYAPEADWKHSVESFLSRDEIPWEILNKKAAKKASRRPKRRDGQAGSSEEQSAAPVKTLDLKKLIFQMKIDPESEEIFLRCACGSSANLKPEEAVHAYLSWLGIPYQPRSLSICRNELYAKGEKGLVALDELGVGE